MMRVYIEGRQLDLHEGEALQVTREIADIREPDARSSDWSKTYRIPGTANNNRIFGHIFDINQEQLNTGTQFAPDFNPNKKASALVTVDEVEQVRGYMRLLNINVIRRGEIEYEVSVHGVAADLFAKIRNLQLSDIDLADLNHTLNRTNIKDSWTHHPNDGYVYPMIDRGRDLRPVDLWAVDEFKPAVFAKTLVDRIFTAAGYTYTDDSFFNSEPFTKLVIPSPGTPTLNEAQLTNKAAKAQRSSAATVAKGGTVVFNDDSSTGYYDNGGNFNTGTGKYTGPTGGGRYTVTAFIKGSITGLSQITYPNLSLIMGIYAGGKLVEQFSPLRMINTPSGASRNFTGYVHEVFIASGEDIEVRVVDVIDYVGNRPGVSVAGGTVSIDTGSYVQIDPYRSSYGNGQTVDMNGMFVGNVWKQDEFLRGLIRLFNLYIEPTGKTNELHIAPRDSFYRNTVVHDLTAKIDRSQPMTIRPMGELDGNPYVFTYKAGEDLDSKEYVEAMSVTYGEARILVDNEFIKEEKKIETVFASTPYAIADGANFRIASMVNKDERAGSLRLLYWSGTITETEWILADYYVNGAGIQGGYEEITVGYPHAGHLDSPFTPTIDLCFGMPAYVNLPAGVSYTNNNLFNAYWRKYISEITDRNSRIVEAMVYVTPADWQRWSFRDLYFFDGQYFRLNKIIDYPIGTAELTRCEFLKIKEGAAFTPATGGTGGGYDVKDDNNDRWPDVISRPRGSRKRFGWTTVGASNDSQRRPVIDWTQGVVNLTAKDVGTPSSGDNFRVAIQWDGADWNINLIQEP